MGQESSRNDCTFQCEVETAPLSDLLQPEEAQQARLIKIDVEGAEWLAVAGMRPLLHSGRPDLEVMVEVCPERLARQGKRPADLLEVFEEAGFHAYRLENDYSPESYLAPVKDKRPARIVRPVESETDMVFSRQDAEML